MFSNTWCTCIGSIDIKIHQIFIHVWHSFFPLIFLFLYINAYNTHVYTHTDKCMCVFRIRYKKYIELYINIYIYIMKEISDLFTCVNLLFYFLQLVHIFLYIYLWSVSLFLCIYLWHHKMTYFKQQENCYFSFLTANKWIKRNNFCLLFRVSIKNVSIDYNFALSLRSLSFSHKGHMRLSFHI